MSDLGHEFQTTFDAAPEPDPEFDRVGSGKSSRADWIKLATWAIFYPAIIALIDVGLFRAGGYLATITAASRRLLRDYPWIIGMPVGVVVGGLSTHFFLSFPGAPLSRTAFLAYLVGIPIGGAYVYFRLYG